MLNILLFSRFGSGLEVSRFAGRGFLHNAMDSGRFFTKFAHRQDPLFNQALNLDFYRKFSTSPLLLFRRITIEEYGKASAKVDQISREHLKKMGITSENLPKSIPIEDVLSASQRPSTVTPNLLIWQFANLTNLELSKDGNILLLNNDKEILIKTLASLSEIGHLSFKDSVIIVNEGCDNGDYLSLIIPYLLKKCGQEMSLKVFLTNGHVKKLEKAAAVASDLLGSKEHVSISLANAFDGIPDQLEKYPGYQKLFLFFRLVITESDEKVKSFIKERLEIMQNEDIAMASFLKAEDDVNKKAMSKYGYDLSFSKDGIELFKKELTPRIVKMFQQKGLQNGQNEIYNVAFTEEAIQKMIKSAGGEILSMSLIPSTTDDGGKNNLIGVIFRRDVRD